MAFTPRLKPDGTPCCTRLEGGRMAYGLRTASGALTACPACMAHHRAAQEQRLRTTEDTLMENYAPPDSYGPSLAKLRAASATPLSSFEESYKARRRAEFEREYRKAEAPRLTAAEPVAHIPPPPDPWAAGIQAMKDARK